MLIYDTKNNYDGRNKGMLYLSVMDADYILKKYTAKELYSLISYDYAQTISEECECIDSPLDVQNYGIISLGIETDKDEMLVKILREEVTEGNLFTKSDIEHITESEANDLITELLTNKETNMDAFLKEGLTRIYYQYSYYDLTLEELYKLRTYEMIKYILKEIEEANHQRNLADEQIHDYGIYDERQYHRATDKLRAITRNLENMGLSADITESNYFKEPSGPTLTKKA